MSLISFVIPCYRSEETLPGVVAEISDLMKTMSDYDHEIILVNDSSPDDTYGVICSLAQADPHIIGIDLAKNFGQHAALMAGYAKSSGDMVISLDDDGQTPANEADKLIRALEDGNDVVYARYDHKRHSPFRNFGSCINERMTRIMLGKPKELYISSYFAARRFVIDEMLKYHGSYPYIQGLVLRTTRNIVNVDVNHRERTVGRSGYTLGKLLSLWMNGFTAFSIKPLRIATMMGGISAFASLVYGIYTIIKKFVRPDVPVGFSALICAILFVGGMLMVMLGLVGEYVGRTYIYANEAPQYVVRDCTGQKRDD